MRGGYRESHKNHLVRRGDEVTRGECATLPRPCPRTACRHHLVAERAAGLEVGPSCTLDVADRGGLTLEEVGAILGVTRERIRQIETNALRKAGHKLRVIRARGDV